MKRSRVTILGGGFAGLACANGLDSRRFDVTLIDRKAHFEFIPNIHELVSGVKKPGQLRIPLKASLNRQGHRFLRGAVVAMDGDERSVFLDNGRRIDGDYLVLACGAEDADYGVSGVNTHALRLRSVADGLAIHKAVTTVTRQPRRPAVVVVGAGLAGVEVVGELLRRNRERALSLHLVEAREALLPGVAPPVGAYVRRRLEDAGVTCHTGTAAVRLTPKTLRLADGAQIRSALTIWTGGPRPADFLAASHFAAARRWAPVDKCLEHSDFDNVFVAGDSAATPVDISKQAYHALDMGTSVAASISARNRGRPLRPYKPAGKPTLLALGDLDTILIAGDRALAGPALATGKEAVFAAVMAQLDRRPGVDRAAALLDRGRQARRALLWPALKDWKSLRQQARLQPIL